MTLIFYQFQSYHQTDTEFPLHVFNICYLLKTLTSLLNPILYSAMNREFRQAVQQLIRMTKNGVSLTMDRMSSNPPVMSMNQRGSDSGFRETEILDV